MMPSMVLSPSGSPAFVFVQPALRSPITAATQSIRTAAAAQQVSAPATDSGSNVWLGAAAAFVGTSVFVAASQQRRQRTLRTGAAANAPDVAAVAPTKSAKTSDKEAPAKKTQPPPPPPFDPAKQPGVTLPLLFFDPLGFCKKGDKESFRKYRTAEIKHGRVAMLAALGAVSQHWFRFPGFDQVPSGVQAITTFPGAAGLVALILGAGVVETQLWVEDPNKEPGNFGDPAGIGQYYEEWRNRELNNGRFAMIAIMGIIVAELVTGKDGFDQVWVTTVGDLKPE